MYDNIDMTLKHDCSPETDFFTAIPQHLTTVKSEGRGQYGSYVIGYLDSLKIRITENGVRVYDSSLCKYFHGSNFKTMTRTDTKRAIEKISDCLHLPFHLATLIRIDAAQNFIMKHPEQLYYNYLGEAHPYMRLEQNNGLYYNLKQGKRQMLYYGKEYEQKTKRQPIPELYKGRNVLRYEFRLKKQLKKQLNRNEVTARLLYDNAFYNDIVQRWKREYFAIQKINSKLAGMKPTGSTKKLTDYLALYTLLELGQPQILRKVKEWQESHNITKKQAQDLRNKIKSIASIKIDEKGNELINELDRKVKEAARYC